MAGPTDVGSFSKEDEVQITFVRSANGKNRTLPLWFTVEGGKMELLPVSHNRKASLGALASGVKDGLRNRTPFRLI